MGETVPAKIIIALPAYNEEKYIGTLVLLARQYAGEVIVVDDGSTDRTTRVASLAGATVIKHGANRGYGAAIQSILAEAKKRNPDSLVLIDADSQHNPDEIPTLIKAVSEGFDLVIGSRKLQVSSDIPLLRRFGQRVILYFTNILSGRRLSDTESGFRAFSGKAVSVLELKEEGMAVSAETVSAATAKGLSVTEVPISVSYTKDSSTMNPVKHGLGVLNRVMVMISERRPLLFFGLGGVISIVLGIISGISVARTVFATQVLQTGTALISMLFITVGVLGIFTGLILNVLVKRMNNSLDDPGR